MPKRNFHSGIFIVQSSFHFMLNIRPKSDTKLWLNVCSFSCSKWFAQRERNKNIHLAYTPSTDGRNNDTHCAIVCRAERTQLIKITRVSGSQRTESTMKIPMTKYTLDFGVRVALIRMMHESHSIVSVCIQMNAGYLSCVGFFFFTAAFTSSPFTNWIS